MEAAEELGYPVLVKADSSSGGVGVRECRCEADVLALEGAAGFFEGRRMLVQQKIEGREMDLSAVYFSGELVHFACSVVERSKQDFGVSDLRTYYPLPLVPEEVFSELKALGRALDAEGFVSITAIEAADSGGRYYFEADMRPNAWVDFSRFYGEDAALRIGRWFADGTVLRKESVGAADGVKPITIPYFSRVKRWELLVNRFGVWRFIPWADCGVVLSLLSSRLGMLAVRKLVPRGVRQIVKRGMILAAIPFP